MPDGRSSAGTYFLGRYRVVDEIGIGGMASVHLARMDGPGGFQKWVAIKRIHPHLVEDQTFIHMFLDEARIAARISHPNVATVFDLGEHENTYWIAMEYLHGEPLREVMRRTEEIGQPMPPEIACRVIADAAEGLHSAHELLGKNGEKLGLVHRDVTPHNLFVTYDGSTKVVDFGIAKFSSRMSSTRAGTLKGKLAYMSPEQVHGEGIDRRTDIFALAVVLWELTTGQRLFRMESDLDTLAKVQECNVPRPSTIVRGYPIDLEKIVMKALSKNRGERFKSARELSRALQSLLMRRGLFIASDEVAAYMKQIFDERIKKREAHLRWAAEVTQTINIEGILTRPQPPIGGEGSLDSYSSEVQPAPTARNVQVRPAAGAPADYKAPSATNPLGAPRLPQTPTLRPPARQRPEPELHPSYDEGPTLQASPQARAQMMEVAQNAAADLADDDGEDNDDTIVTTTRVEGHPYQSLAAPTPAAGKPATFPPPATARGVAPPPRENVAFAAPPRNVPPRAHAPLPLPAVVVAPPPPPPPASNLDRRSTAHVDALLAEALAEQRGQPPPPTPQVTDVLDDALRLPASPRAHNPTVPRLFAPPMPVDLRTDTARQMKRPPPMWMVALGSGMAALVAAGAVISLATWTSSRAATPVAPAPVPPAPAHVIPIVPGPFGAARAAFTSAITVTSAPVSPAPSPPASAAPAASAAAPSPPPSATMTPPAPTPAAAAPTPAPRPAPAAAWHAPRRTPTAVAAPAAAAPSGSDSGQLTVICFPACDTVSDNGAVIGPSPIFKHRVSVGQHRLKMTSSNPPATKIVSVIVMGDQTTTVRQPMTP
jgi:serine/threonine-protein kinase